MSREFSCKRADQGRKMDAAMQYVRLFLFNISPHEHSSAKRVPCRCNYRNALVIWPAVPFDTVGGQRRPEFFRVVVRGRFECKQCNFNRPHFSTAAVAVASVQPYSSLSQV